MSIMLVRHNNDGTHQIRIYCMDSLEESTIANYSFTESGILIHCEMELFSREHVEKRMKYDIDTGFYKPCKKIPVVGMVK